MTNCMWYYFNDIIKFEDFDLDNILIDEKSYETILVYNTSYKTSIDAKPLHIKLDKMDAFIRVYDGARYLVLFWAAKYDSIYNSIRYLIGIISGITYVISHNYARIKIDSYDSLSLEKMFTFRNVIIFIKSVFNKDKNNYYYNIFLEKCSYN